MKIENTEKILLLKYTHPACIQFKEKAINASEVYNLEELLTVYNMKFIKSYFEPNNFKWEEIENKQTTNVINTLEKVEIKKDKTVSNKK